MAGTPKSGYRFERKKDYRRHVLSVADKVCNKPRSERRCLLLSSADPEKDDTSHCLDAKLLRSYGYKVENLLLVNNSAKEVKIMRANGWLAIQSNVFSVLSELSFESGDLFDLVWLDGISDVSEEFLDTITTIWDCPVVHPNTLIVCTFLRGRTSNLYWLNKARGLYGKSKHRGEYVFGLAVGVLTKLIVHGPGRNTHGEELHPIRSEIAEFMGRNIARLYGLALSDVFHTYRSGSLNMDSLLIPASLFTNELLKPTGDMWRIHVQDNYQSATTNRKLAAWRALRTKAKRKVA